MIWALPPTLDTGVYCRHDAALEELGLKEDLAVGYRYNVRGYVRGNVSGLGLDYGQRCERSPTELVAELGCALEQPRVQVEYVAGVGFASRRPSDEQGHGSVCYGVLGEVIVDEQHVLALMHEVLAHAAARVRSYELQRGGLGRRRGNDHGVIHGSRGLQHAYYLRHRGPLLAYGDVYADDVSALLIQYGIDRYGRLSGLAVSYYELSLAPADRDHGVYGLDARLQRFADALSFE